MKNSNLRVLTADYGYIIKHKETGSVYTKVYLGVNDSEDNYEIIVNETVTNDIYAYLKDMKNSNLDRDTSIEVLMMALDELFMTFEPLLDMFAELGVTDWKDLLDK